MVPGHQQYVCGGLVVFFSTNSPPLCLANNLGLGLALSWYNLYWLKLFSYFKVIFASKENI